MYIIKPRIILDARNPAIVADHYLMKETKISQPEKNAELQDQTIKISKNIFSIFDIIL
jgi:hypothetical protein